MKLDINSEKLCEEQTTNNIEQDNEKESKEKGRKAFLALCCCSCREYEVEGT